MFFFDFHARMRILNSSRRAYSSLKPAHPIFPVAPVRNTVFIINVNSLSEPLDRILRLATLPYFKVESGLGIHSIYYADSLTGADFVASFDRGALQAAIE